MPLLVKAHWIWTIHIWTFGKMLKKLWYICSCFCVYTSSIWNCRHFLQSHILGFFKSILCDMIQSRYLLQCCSLKIYFELWCPLLEELKPLWVLPPLRKWNLLKRLYPPHMGLDPSLLFLSLIHDDLWHALWLSCLTCFRNFNILDEEEFGDYWLNWDLSSGVFSSEVVLEFL